MLARWGQLVRKVHKAMLVLPVHRGYRVMRVLLELRASPVRPVHKVISVSLVLLAPSGQLVRLETLDHKEMSALLVLQVRSGCKVTLDNLVQLDQPVHKVT
jgi:hypothetical protein